ncbi:TonB-dependent receptor domain-containing protein [Mucilaginibacter sp.]|uniref:TonB-dependent receptor domain-containing protein n=1 Tax=Mucilaginibacter sp. TaxID=1882438 RepID=UPI002ECFEA5B
MQLIKILFCLILCNWFTSVFAQTSISLNIKGQIIDVQNSPLPYVTVNLKSAKDSVSYKSEQSDNNGLFLIPNVAPGDYILSVSMVGFETLQQRLSVNGGQPLIDMGRLTLKSTVKVLNNVIVKAEPKLVEHQLDKTVVNIGRSVTTEGSTVWEVLRKLPGVQVSPDGQILLNGKPGVNVLIDGKTTYLSAEDLHGLLDGMQASGIQRVELMSNPSSKYDAAGTAGIINIVKKKNNKEGFNGNVNASLAQSYFGRYNGGFTFSYKNEHFNLLLNNTYTYNKRYSASNVISDIHDTGNKLLSEQVSDNNGNNIGRNYRPSLALDIYIFKRTTITLSGTLSNGIADNGFVSAMDVLDSLRNKVSHIYYRSKLHDSPFNYTAGIQLTHQLDTNGRLFTINADHAEYRYFPLQTNYSTLDDATGSFLSETNNLLLQHRQLDIYAAKMDYVRPLKNKSVFEAGVKSSYVKADNNNSVYDLADNRQIFDQTQSDHSINSEHINAAYINFNKNWPNISVEAGIRAEQTITKGKEIVTGATIDQNYLQLFPTLFLSDHINEQNALTLRLGRRTDRPDYHEYVPFRRPLTATLFFQGNPNLKPQTSWHGELGWNFLQSFTITLNYDIYRGYVRTLPFLDSNKTTITRRPINIQGAHGWETDLAYNKKMLSWWTTNNTLAVYSNAFNGQAFGAKLDNAGLVSLQFNTNNIFTISSLWSAECDYEYDTRRQYVNSVFGAYSLLDLGLKRSIFMGKGSLTLNANNILQSEDHNALDRNAGLYQVTNLHFYSRAVTLSFTYRFGTVKPSKIKIDSGAADEQRRAGN